MSTIKFLEYSNSNAIYVRNAENWRIYKINEIEFVLDAQTYDSIIFPYLFNTYEIIITWYQTSIYSKNVPKVQLHFNITFTDPTDMNLYFIGQTKDQVMLHSYGDQNFNVRLDDFYMGPNKIFGFELVSSPQFGSNITLPKIFNAYEKKIASFQLDLKYPWSKALVLRKTNNFAPYSYLSLHWILENYIEHYIYDNEGRNVIKLNGKEYLYSNFIDYFITKDVTKYFRNKELLVILSKEKSNQIYEYVVHIFDIEKEKIFWIAKFYFNKNSSKLREHKPIIPLPYTHWVILVDESEKDLYFVPNDPEKLIYTLNSEQKIMFAFPTISDQLYVSHYNDNKISIYKVYKYEDESGNSTISIEFIRYQVFNITYVWFDIDIYGLALVFTNLNTIYIYQMKTLFDMKIVRIINFFKFMTTYEFWTNKDKNDIVYSRKDSYLFIVMSNISDPAQRSLFIFDLSMVSHNSLKSTIELDKTHFSQHVYLKINADEYSSVIYVYLHNEKNYFRLIQFEPENSLRK